MKKICSLKDTVKRLKRLARDWKKILGKHLFDKELVPRTCFRLKETTLTTH